MSGQIQVCLEKGTSQHVNIVFSSGTKPQTLNCFNLVVTPSPNLVLTAPLSIATPVSLPVLTFLGAFKITYNKIASMMASVVLQQLNPLNCCITRLVYSGRGFIV